METSSQRESNIPHQNLGILFSDLIIGACLGSVLGIVFSSLFLIPTGLVGFGCAAIGAAIGGGFYRLHDASSLSISDNPHSETLTRPFDFLDVMREISRAWHKSFRIWKAIGTSLMFIIAGGGFFLASLDIFYLGIDSVTVRVTTALTVTMCSLILINLQPQLHAEAYRMALIKLDELITRSSLENDLQKNLDELNKIAGDLRNALKKYANIPPNSEQGSGHP